MKELVEFMRANRERRVMLLLHSQADLDTTGAAAALSEFFKNARIVTPDVITSAAKRLKEHLGLRVESFESMRFKPESIIVLDTNSCGLLAGMCDYVTRFRGDVAVIDHHTIHSDAVKAKHFFVDNTASSTCEIVYELFRELNFPITERAAVAMMLGIYHDSHDFRASTKRTFEVMAYLLRRTRRTPASIFALAQERVPDVGQRMALLKAFQRAVVQRVGNFIIVTSKSETHEAAAAERMVELGADFAFVAQHTHSEVRLSARCNPALVERMGVNLGLMMHEVGKVLGGSGGGHPGAAGANGPRVENVEAALRLCERLAKDALKAAGMKKIEGIG